MAIANPVIDAAVTLGLRDADKNAAFRREIERDPRFALVIPDVSYQSPDEYLDAELGIVTALKAHGYNLVKCTAQTYHSPDGVHTSVAGRYNPDGTMAAYYPRVAAVIAGRSYEVDGWFTGNEPGDRPSLSGPPKSLQGLRVLLATANRERDINRAVAERHAAENAKREDDIRKSERAAELSDWRDPEHVEQKFSELKAENASLNSKLDYVIGLLKAGIDGER